MQIAAPWTLEKVKRSRQEFLEDLNIMLFGQIEQMLKSM
jgi:hypothetical protein